MMDKAPEKIYLQCFFEDGILLDVYAGDVEWSMERVYDNDGEYVPAARAEKAEERLAEAREVLRSVEAVELWDPGDGEWYVGCARCGAESEKDEHYDDCKLATALAGGEGE
jgi:hypothetical protein